MRLSNSNLTTGVSPASPSARLRATIAELHEAIEQVPIARGMVTGKISRGSYLDLLARLLVLHEALEGHFAEHLPSELFGDDCRRQAAIERDITALGGQTKEESSEEVQQLVANLCRLGQESPLAWAGALYVLEGSRMGSMVLQRTLARAFQVDPVEGQGLDYHLEGMEQAPVRFRAFKEIVDRVLSEERDLQAACSGAYATMSTLCALYQGVPCADDVGEGHSRSL